MAQQEHPREPRPTNGAGLTAAGTNTTRIGITINAPVAELPTTGPESDTPMNVALILIAIGILTRLRTRHLN